MAGHHATAEQVRLHDEPSRWTCACKNPRNSSTGRNDFQKPGNKTGNRDWLEEASYVASATVRPKGAVVKAHEFPVVVPNGTTTEFPHGRLAAFPNRRW